MATGKLILAWEMYNWWILLLRRILLIEWKNSQKQILVQPETENLYLDAITEIEITCHENVQINVKYPHSSEMQLKNELIIVMLWADINVYGIGKGVCLSGFIKQNWGEAW